MTYDNIKSYKKPGLPFSLVHTFLENPQRGGVCVCMCVCVCVCVCVCQIYPHPSPNPAV